MWRMVTLLTDQTQIEIISAFLFVWIRNQLPNKNKCFQLKGMLIVDVDEWKLITAINLATVWSLQASKELSKSKKKNWHEFQLVENEKGGCLADAYIYTVYYTATGNLHSFSCSPSSWFWSWWCRRLNSRCIDKPRYIALEHEQGLRNYFRTSQH